MIILKVGGGKEINFSYLANDIKSLIDKEKFIIVVGANYHRNILAQKLGINIEIIESESGYKSVYTDEKMIDLILMTYAGLRAKRLTAELIKNKIKAISLCGIDNNLIVAKKKIITAKINNKIKLITDSYTGKIEKINQELLDYFLENNYVVVLTQPAISIEGEILNTDNDQIIFNLAKIYKPDKIIFLIEAPGILKDKNNEKSLIKKINLNELDDLIQKIDDYGFQKKLINIKKLMELKNFQIIVADGREIKPISRALNLIGTVIVNNGE